MDEEDDYYYRNDYWDEAADRSGLRNARRRPPPRRMISVGGNQNVPWTRPLPAPVVVTPARPGLRDLPTGVWAEVATQVAVMVNPLPQPPPSATDDLRQNLNNLMIYQTALAQYTKRNEQIRTVGYLARLFV